MKVDKTQLIDPGHKELSIRKQCEILEVNRSSFYYRTCGESELNIALMGEMDKIFLDDPTSGVLGTQDELLEKGYKVNVKRIRRLMGLMGYEAIYPRRNLTKMGKAKFKHPYLLKNLKITKPNEVWAIDITYIPMKKGFMYLTAIIDVYSRYIVGWQVSNSLAKETQTELLQWAIEQHGKPEIVNSDQGSQYTCANWVEFLKETGIKISMDGRGRATDNAFIERFFRTLKQKHIYLYPAENGWQLQKGVQKFIAKYNQKRHQGIDRQKPVNLYKIAA